MPHARLLLSIVLAASALLIANPAEAQLSQLAGCKFVKVGGGSEWERDKERHLLREAPDQTWQIDCDGMQFFADSMELYEVSSGNARIDARGHVLFVSGGNRISAERMEFNTGDRTGTFYNASGTIALGERVDKSLFGTQEPDAMFYGAEVHKLGPRKYRLVRGGFTTCVQPTPRWELVSGKADITLNDYALLRNTIFRIKGVPIFYLPVFYYPIQDDDRATGFVIPVYGNTDIQGHSVKNAFFWAINRSQDATFYHDWYSQTGQGMGGEYRYVLAPGSQGNARVYFLNERETTYLQSNGTARTTPARKSYSVRGDLAQRLPGGLYARANTNYFSSITTEQRYQQDVYQATNRQRSFGANVTGSWGPYSLSATADRNDVFYDEETVVRNGSLPRVSFSHGERPIARLPIYFGATSEFVSIQRATLRDGVAAEDEDLGLSRLDVTPTIRIPFSRWPFLTINSAISWRGTYWSESMDNGVRVPDPVGRRYFDFQSRITGPTFNRIFDTPNSAYAQRLKHVIEPSLTVQRVTAIDNRNRIPQLEGPDYVIGNVTRFTYALSNRLYAKRETAREILAATISQSYYTDQNAVDLDQQYQSSFSGGRAPTHFSPVALQVRTTPSERFQADFRTEWDARVSALRTLAANGTFNTGGGVFTSVGWSQRRFIPDLPGFDDPLRADHYLNATTTFQTARNRFGGTYAFNYDLRRDAFLQQRVLAYYNAQCCGVALEYQVFNWQGQPTVGVPQDRRFNLSFTLAGIGTFSNFFGALAGGQQTRR
jgi:LPS-assembly protein